MTTQFVSSVNQFQIAYDVQGAGPALLLVHGFSNNRTMWQHYGWVDYFQTNYTVITLDIRGCGESTATQSPTDYTHSAHLADVAAVLDACGVDQCLYWGWSFGGTLGTHLAAFTDHLQRAVIAGTYFGPLFNQERWRNDNLELIKLAKAKREGRLAELASPSEQHRHFAETTDLDLLWARRYAVESWPAIEPADLRCPALVYTGTNDGNVVVVLRQQQPAITAAGLTLHIFDSLDHRQLVSERATVGPVVKTFFRQG